eukprot:2261835-Alexandrium_andersonii.AAC.1
MPALRSLGKGPCGAGIPAAATPLLRTANVLRTLVGPGKRRIAASPPRSHVSTPAQMRMASAD